MRLSRTPFRFLPTTSELVVFALLIVLPSHGCKSKPPDRSVVIEDRGPSEKVENGTAYDRATVDLGNVKRLVLLDSAVVRHGGEPGRIELFMAKTLSFAGHPPEPMSIRSARNNMGCATRREENALIIATYGEWDSHIEGGANLKLVALVTEGVRVEQREGLSGPTSAGQEWHSPHLSKPPDASGGYWYGPASPADGWQAVIAVPDPERTAR